MCTTPDYNMNIYFPQKMKKILLSSVVLFLTFLIFNANAREINSSKPDAGWKAGVAKVCITPSESLWLAGYGFRNRPSEGTISDLWVKALALEDATGNKSVLVTMDLEEIPKSFSDRIRDQLSSRHQLSRAQVILNVSHTHSSPVLDDFGDIYPLDVTQMNKIKIFTQQLFVKIIDVVGEAIQTMEPASLLSGSGISRFQVNRRNNDESNLARQTELKGPNDYSVPVIKVLDQKGKVKTIVFGYACHNTVLSEYKWSGDYAGFAQSALENMFPGATAMFFQGCGSDQNPLPRRTVALAQQYGQTLAASVERVLNGEMKELSAQLYTSYKEIDLPLAKPPSKADLLEMEKRFSGYQKRWATRHLETLNKGASLATSYPYPLQIWQLGDQIMMALGGEVAIEYAIQLKRIFGQSVFVLGYSNDVMAYIPTTTIIAEGGYEGASSVMTTYLPATWAADTEVTIIDQMVLLAKEAGISKKEFEWIKSSN